MRRILITRARRKSRQRRGSGAEACPILNLQIVNGASLNLRDDASAQGDKLLYRDSKSCEKILDFRFIPVGQLLVSALD